VADKIIDFHTHLGLSFLGSPPVDLDREDDEALTFFPARGNAADMNTYSAKSFTEESEKVAQKESFRQAFSKGGYAGTHTPKNLLKEMDYNRVTHSVILAIDFNLGALSRNSKTYMEASRRYPRLIPFVSVHPNDARMERKVRKFHQQGAKGMKIHPPMQFIRANNKKCMKLTKLCGELGLPVLFHSGASNIQPRFQDDYCRIEHWLEPVRAQPETTFILAHGGIYFWKELIELARKNENVWIELSNQPPAHIREMIDAGLEDRMLYGSDWPYYIISLPLAKVLLATDDAPKIREKIVYGNAKRLLKTVGVEV
jgi:predicted TIM-barrel fold metal-dependent hydrolase